MNQAPAVPFRIEHEGVTLEAQVMAPAGAGPHAAVLLFPGGAGPGPSFRQAGRDLAALGYLAICIDMYGAEADISTPQAAGVYFAALLEAPDTLRSRVVAWFEAVCAREDVDAGRVSAIGYCFGGKCVLELARSGAPVRSVTSFHGLLQTHAPARPGTVRAKIAIWTGALDPYVPLEHFEAVRAELDAAGAQYQVTSFAWAAHSFTDPDHEGAAPGIVYDELAHRISWAGTLALLEQCSR